MPLISYVPRKFSPASLAITKQANQILADYQKDGYTITLRQLYYQFVSRDLFPESWADEKTGSTNNQRSYKNLGSIVNDARLAGLIDWSYMEDRTRNLVSPPAWGSPADIIDACSRQFRIDKWARQPYRPEVWIEKDALAGVFERVCLEHQVPWFSCRGYTSQSEMWAAGQRLARYAENNQIPVIFHFGDHDPSGIDMTRDIVDRIGMFMTGMKLERLALNQDQVDQYQPPPNPAKITDSRAARYIEIHGDESWELDALEPAVLAQLVTDAIAGIRDEDVWAEDVEAEAEHRRLLQEVSSRWPEVTDGI